MKACCIGCSAPSAAARPSIVVTGRPCAADRQRQAGEDAPAVDEDGAGAALAVVAALLGAGQAEMLAQRVEQRRADVERQAVLLAVDPQGDGHGRPRVDRRLLGLGRPAEEGCPDERQGHGG